MQRGLCPAERGPPLSGGDPAQRGDPRSGSFTFLPPPYKVGEEGAYLFKVYLNETILTSIWLRLSRSLSIDVERVTPFPPPPRLAGDPAPRGEGPRIAGY